MEREPSIRAVICVDDEAVILMALGMELRKGLGPGFVVETASTLADALAVAGELAADGIPLACLVTDWIMPGARGEEVAERLRVLSPGLPVVLMTGHDETSEATGLISRGGPVRVVRKPWHGRGILEAVLGLAGNGLPE